jgi:hypothetical protein
LTPVNSGVFVLFMLANTRDVINSSHTMNTLKPVITEHPEGRYFRIRSDEGTHVEVVDDFGFVGFDPTSEEILEAYVSDTGKLPESTEELTAFGGLVLRTAWYHQEIFEAGMQEMELFGIDTEELREVGYALSLDTLHSDQVYPLLSEIRASS